MKVETLRVWHGRRRSLPGRHQGKLSEARSRALGDVHVATDPNAGAKTASSWRVSVTAWEPVLLGSPMIDSDF